ncbi:carbohydrate porin [Novipirellula artificiosorum]|uniref:Carbohydrate-selective porin, OprB family n=1 Tax=Novipirellula artificiosorum TaxID=2528016 RepID=A0A5C6D6H6_9BACT|nr:carbohydrate porin [Novipirellula artificiosorum]TWU30846.1 Carbohydrate-selective porin, OprB family [Novipirellula artificiosorum]
MKLNSLCIVLFAILGFLLLQPANAQLVDVDVTDTLNLLDPGNDPPAASQILPVGHFLHGGIDTACCDTRCDIGCDSAAIQPSCDAMGGCSCSVGKPKCECCKCRETFFGDMGGYRKCFAEHGIMYKGTFTQFYQGVSSGGANETYRYGSKLDSHYIADTEKLGLWEGGTLIMHAESAYGQNSILDAAAMAPANTAFMTPRINDYPMWAITHFQYEHELGEGYAATFGRFNFIDLWSVFYPGYGQGLDGFMNTSSMIFLNVVPTLPIIFNGAGIIKAGEKGVEAALLVLDPENIPSVSGLDDVFDNGSTVLGAYRVFTEFGGLSGSHMAAGTYENRTLTDYDRNGWSFHPVTGIAQGQKTGSWLAAYVGQQTLWQDRCDKQRRVWFTTTMGWADRETSPYEWMGTYSIEAIGLNANRPHDRMGISYFYSDVSDDLEKLVPAAVGLQDLQGGEFYYNAEINPWFHLTGDIQAIQTEIASQDTAIVLGVRAKITL